VLDARLEDGCAVADPGPRPAEDAVIERHLASGSLGKGFIQGIGLKRGGHRRDGRARSS